MEVLYGLGKAMNEVIQRFLDGLFNGAISGRTAGPLFSLISSV